MGFCTRRLVYIINSLVRVSRRVNHSSFGKISVLEPSGQDCSFEAQLQSEIGAFAQLIPAALTSFCPLSQKNNAKGSQHPTAAFEVPQAEVTTYHATRLAQIVSAIPYFSTISGLLTLFSKFFSSFLHSTCSLSVSHKYLALEEVYLPFKAAIPNNPTLRNPSYGGAFAKYGSFTLFASQFHGLMQGTILLRNPLDYNSAAQTAADFNFELLPVRSPLLR